MSVLTFIHEETVWDWEGIKPDSFQNPTCELLSLTSPSWYRPLPFLSSFILLESEVCVRSPPSHPACPMSPKPESKKLFLTLPLSNPPVQSSGH